MALSMEMQFLLSSIAFISINSCCLGLYEDDFHEELFIKPLPTGHIYTHFQFTTTWDVELKRKDEFLHYHLFPKALGEVLAKFSVQELHLTLTRGLWRHEKWGYPTVDAPPGAELWVWFQSGTTNVDETWMDLINVLSGMFCASLNYMDTKNTVCPKLSFRPKGATTAWYSKTSSNLLRYAALPRENVCTENLTPWKKLLPCGSKAGIASLFNSVKLYDTNYHSLGVHFRPVCRGSDCKETSLELSQTLSVVLEPAISSNARHDWSFKKLFGRMIGAACPVAQTSTIYVDVTSNKTSNYQFSLNPAPSRIESFRRGQEEHSYAIYEIREFTGGSRVLNLAAKYTQPITYSKVAPPVLYAHRFQTGYGREKGGIVSLLHNTHPTQDLLVVYMEVIPWFLRVYIHTLTIETFTAEMKHIGVNGTTLQPLHLHYIPSKDRQRPSHLELLLRLPPASVTRLSLQFERALLKWTEYPPDANHGFYVNAAVVSATLPLDSGDYVAAPQSSTRISAILSGNASTPLFVRVHTETLLVMLPTPDFSMPYNVICLACTVVAIAFGSIHNLTTRRFTTVDPTAKKGLLARLKAKIPFLARKKAGEEEGEKSRDGDERGSETGTIDEGKSGPDDGTEKGKETGTTDEGKSDDGTKKESKTGTVESVCDVGRRKDT